MRTITLPLPHLPGPRPNRKGGLQTLKPSPPCFLLLLLNLALLSPCAIPPLVGVDGPTHIYVLFSPSAERFLYHRPHHLHQTIPIPNLAHNFAFYDLYMIFSCNLVLRIADVSGRKSGNMQIRYTKHAKPTLPELQKSLT